MNLGMIFDNKLANGDTLLDPMEAYTRVGEVLYKVISGAGACIDSILSNSEAHVTTPSSDISGNKRRNYY